MTTSSTTSGELAKPQSGTCVPVSDAALRDHTTAPLRGVERVQDSGRAERVDAAVAEGRRRRADRRRHSTPRTGPRRGVSTPARRWSRCSRRRSRRHRAAPACRGDRRGPRRTTSPVRSAGATARPAATRTSRSRSARRERCRRARVRESRAIRLASEWPPDRQRRPSQLLPELAGPRPACRQCRPWLALWELPLVPQVAAATSATRRWPGPEAVPRESASTASGTRTLRRKFLLSARASTARTRAGWSPPTTRAELAGARRPAATAQATRARLSTGMRVHVEQHPHHPAGNRLVDDPRRREQCDDHQDDGTHALGPGRAAEEHPPHDNGQRAERSPKKPQKAERHVEDREILRRNGRNHESQ